MKGEVSAKIGIAIVVVVVLVLAGVGWKLFTPHQETKSDKDAFLASHPGAKAAMDNMAKMSANPTPPPGAMRDRYYRR